jgi:hypothetical protein
VKEDRKSFHEEKFDKGTVHKLGDGVHQIAEAIGGGGFVAGVAIGVALSWSWARIHK